MLYCPVNQELYNKLLDEVLNLIPDDTIANPASVMTDSEKAAITAFTAHSDVRLVTSNLVSRQGE